MLASRTRFTWKQLRQELEPLQWPGLNLGAGLGSKVRTNRQQKMAVCALGKCSGTSAGSHRFGSWQLK